MATADHAAAAPAAPVKPFALVGYLDTPATLFHACEALRDAGYKKFDAHTPFPVHGLENAMGLRPSRMPWIVLACAFAGFTSAVAMQYWMSVVDYPLNVGGKAPFSPPNWVPIGFELTILLSAFGAFFGMWIMNGLPRFFHPVMQHPSFQRATDDRFFGNSNESQVTARSLATARAASAGSVRPKTSTGRCTPACLNANPSETQATARQSARVPRSSARAIPVAPCP
jgi:hypothetical protein